MQGMVPDREERFNLLRDGRGLNFFRAGEAKIILSPNIYLVVYGGLRYRNVPFLWQ